jgi:hypothetical protein
MSPTPIRSTGTRPEGSVANPAGASPTRTASDASGIGTDDRGPIDPRMPHLPPA